MRAHARYAAYVIRHKWFVLRAGMKTRSPLWRLVIHDWSKLAPAEWRPYVRKFYGNWGHAESMTHADAIQSSVNAAFDRAWLHHQHRNPHHWQHWLLQEDDGDLKTLQMPEHFAREMVADWMGAGRAITGEWDVRDWYQRNSHRIALHPYTRELVETLIAGVTT